MLSSVNPRQDKRVEADWCGSGAGAGSPESSPGTAPLDADTSAPALLNPNSSLLSQSLARQLYERQPGPQFQMVANQAQSLVAHLEGLETLKIAPKESQAPAGACPSLAEQTLAFLDTLDPDPQAGSAIRDHLNRWLERHQILSPSPTDSHQPPPSPDTTLALRVDLARTAWRIGESWQTGQSEALSATDRLLAFHETPASSPQNGLPLEEKIGIHRAARLVLAESDLFADRPSGTVSAWDNLSSLILPGATPETAQPTQEPKPVEDGPDPLAAGILMMANALAAVENPGAPSLDETTINQIAQMARQTIEPPVTPSSLVDFFEGEYQNLAYQRNHRNSLDPSVVDSQSLHGQERALGFARETAAALSSRAYSEVRARLRKAVGLDATGNHSELKIVDWHESSQSAFPPLSLATIQPISLEVDQLLRTKTAPMGTELGFFIMRIGQYRFPYQGLIRARITAPSEVEPNALVATILPGERTPRLFRLSLPRPGLVTLRSPATSESEKIAATMMNEAGLGPLAKVISITDQWVVAEYEGTPMIMSLKPSVYPS